MKTSIFVTSTIVAATTVMAVDKYHNPQICSKKNPSVLNAIGQFCQKRNMEVPSQYASEGKWSDNGKIWITINGNCAPTDIVDWGPCFENFYSMCADSLHDVTGTGFVERKYGTNGCQLWTLVANDR